MMEREAVRIISMKTRENSLILPGKVVFGLWNRKTGEVLITDDLHDVVARMVRNYEVIRVYTEGQEMEPIGRRYGEYGEMVHMNRRLYGEIQGMIRGME